jgi:nucleotide-binding universal stress UspA family protein
LPARAIVGVDGTDSDIAIATSTVEVLAESATVHLVHTESGETPSTDGSAYAENTARLVPRFTELGVASVKHTVLRGEPAARLTGYARWANADLIALASPPAATIADRVSGGLRRRILRTFDGYVLLGGAGNFAQSRQT